MAIQVVNREERLKMEFPQYVTKPGEEAPVVYYRRIDLRTHDTIKRKHTRTEKRQLITDDSALNDELLQYVVLGWKGIEDKGVPAPPTPENLKRVYDLLPSDVANAILIAAQDAIPKYAENAEDFADRPASS